MLLADAVSVAGEAGSYIRDVGVAMIAALVPLAVGLIMVKWGLRWATRTLVGSAGGGMWEGGDEFGEDPFGEYRMRGGRLSRDGFADYTADQDQQMDEWEKSGVEFGFDGAGRPTRRDDR